jgi:membrane protease YdiL (CAAX protease family)
MNNRWRVDVHADSLPHTFANFHSMKTADAFYVALIAIGLAIDSFALWPAFLRRSDAEPARARVWLWATAIGLLWTLVAAGVALWILERRSWTELRIVAPHGWRILGTIGLLLAVAVFYARSLATITRARRANKRIKLANDAARRAPHTRAELAWWMALSLSAGICEEFIFRGYLIWVLQPLLGVWVAAAASLVIFAAAHAYEGAKGVVAVAGVGGLLTLIVLAFGSLVPAIAVHVLADAGEGLVAWHALRGDAGMARRAAHCA